MNCKTCLCRFNCRIHLNNNDICEKYEQAQNQERQQNQERKVEQNESDFN